MTPLEIHNFTTFTHLIVRPDGRAYTGSVHGDDRDWASDHRRALPYTAAGAGRKIASAPAFNGCKPLQIR